MNRIILIALLLALSAVSAVGQDRYVNIILHFYGPLSSNRAAFEDSVMTFYDVYNYEKEEIIPKIRVVREDYSNSRDKQKFVKSETGKLSFSDEVKEIKNSENRLNSQPNSILLNPYGIRKYERPSNIDSNYFFLGNKTVPSKNQFASCKEVKTAIQELLNSNKIEELHIHFVSSVDDNYKDRKYDERTFAFLSQYKADNYFLDGNGKQQLNVFLEGYANSINVGKFNTEQYFAKGTIRIGDSLYVESSKINEFYFQNPSFSKLHYIYNNKTIEYVGFESNIFYFSYWTEVECYRPAIEKYEFRLVKMKVGINRQGRIVSLYEIESLGKTIADTNFNPYKNYSPKPGIPANKQGESRSTIPPPPPDPNQVPSMYGISSFATEEPAYIGGLDKLYLDINSNIVYPDAERAAKVSGTVYVAFVVEWDGSVSNVRVEKGVENAPGLNKAAVSAVSNLGFFRPAQLNGNSIRYYYRIPIKFTLR